MRISIIWIGSMLILIALVLVSCGAPDSETVPEASPEPGNGTAPDATPESTVYFPQLLPSDGPRAYPQALFIGELVLEDRCLRVTSGEGGENHLPIWPPEVTLYADADLIEIRNQAGEAIARLGDDVELGGGQIEPSAQLMQELHEPLPDDCPGPYWVTGSVVGPYGRSDQPEAAPDSEGVEEATPEPIDPNDPLLQQYPDAPQYAADFGVSLGEAVRRMQLQDAFPGLEETLRAREAETFGGMWIQHEPEFRFVVAFTRDGEETIAPYVEGGPRDLLEVRTVRYTLSELEAAQTETIRVLQQVGVQTNVLINVMENRVEVPVFDPEDVEEKLQAANVQLSEAAQLVAVDASGSDGNGLNLIMATPTPLPRGVNVFFPQLAPTGGPREMMTALIEGTLINDNGCLRVEATEASTSDLVIWPPEVSLHATESVIEIRNAAGEVIARVGEKVRLGGGEINAVEGGKISEEDLREPLPEACSGPYWIVGEIE